ncbi:MAG: FHA domain-containing protein [Oxalobacteraceae bacterium]
MLYRNRIDRRSNTMATIILMADGAVLQQMPLTKERITIGRRPGNDIVIDNLAISGRHAAITTIHEGSLLEDLGSTNGTLVNGQPVKRHFLQNGDVIELARYRLQYQSEPQRDSAHQARLTIIGGAGNGKKMHLAKDITSIGRPGVAVAAITRSPQGYAITHIEGDTRPSVNGHTIGSAAHALQDGDMLGLAGVAMQFSLK